MLQCNHMNLSQTFHLAFRSLTRNKRRSLLTMLGLIIGIAAVVMVTSIGAGAQSLITNQIKKRGTDTIAILPGASDAEGPPASAFGVVITTLTDDDRKALQDTANVKHLATAASFTTGNDVLKWNNYEEYVTYTGASEEYDVVEKVTVALGNFFTKEEAEAGDHVMVLGSSIAGEIFGAQPPLSQYVRLGGQRFKVIGVLEPKGSTVFSNPDDAVIIPLKAAQNDLLGISHISFIRALVDDETYLEQTLEEVKLTLTERHDDEDFSVRNVADALDILTSITNALRFFLVGIAAVSLFVGGVGIMNIMLISVKQKTREVGLRKAVGATKSDISRQFLIESAFLSLTGGIIGVLIGVSISFVVALIVQYLGYEYDFIVSPISIFGGAGIAALIGLVFGTVPARQAANLDPITALRYE